VSRRVSLPAADDLFQDAPATLIPRRRRFEITERFSGQFRAELFNAFNHVNLGQPNAQVDSPTAGQIFALASLAQMRKWQFGLRLQF